MDKTKEEICSFGELYKSMHLCKKNVMWKSSVSGYVKNGLVNCYNLQTQLMDDTYKIDNYSYFTITEPKVRNIVSTRMKDRVFQKSMCNNYLYEELAKDLIYDNPACQENKGTDFSRRRLTCHMQRHYKKCGLDGYVLQCDIKNYFGSTDHDIAKSICNGRIANNWVKSHSYKIIESFGTKENPNMGMGLGSEVTQLVQLSLLSGLDHFIKEDLKIKRYIRYMDDFILIHQDKEYLKYCKSEISKKLDLINLELNFKKTQIYALKNGIKFLGFSFYLTNTGKVIKKLSKKNISKERRKLRKLKKLVDDGILTKKDVNECYTAWKAHAKKGNTYNLILEMDKYYKELWKGDENDF